MKKLLLSSLLLAFLPLAQAQQSEQDKAAEKTLDGIAEVLLADNEEVKAEVAKMKSDLPKTLKLAKEYRTCLQDTDDKEDVIECRRDAQEKSEKMGLEDEDFNDGWEGDDLKNWTVADKAKELREMDKSITMMEEVMPCVLAAKNPLEIMICGQLIQKNNQ